MAFESLSEKLNAAFKRLRGKGRLTPADVREAMREVRMALLALSSSGSISSESFRCISPQIISSIRGILSIRASTVVMTMVSFFSFNLRIISSLFLAVAFP